MTVKDFHDQFGHEGLVKLAEAAETKISYLRQLMYRDGKKTPSLRVAAAIVRASGGLIHYEDLAFPGQHLTKPVTFRDIKLPIAA